MSDAPALSLPEACAVLKIGRTAGYEQAAAGTFPCRVIKVGGQYRVPTAALRRLLDVPEPTASTATAVSA